MRNRDVPYSDWTEVTSIDPGGYDTAHPDKRMRLQGILFRVAGDLVAVPGANEPDDDTPKTLTVVAANEFHPIDVRLIAETTTALPLVLYYGWNR